MSLLSQALAKAGPLGQELNQLGSLLGPAIQNEAAVAIASAFNTSVVAKLPTDAQPLADSMFQDLVNELELKLNFTL